MVLTFSFIIPVFNRPDEIKELLDSFLKLDSTIPFEIVIVEDGSSIPSKNVVEAFKEKLDITYFYKPNSGPGDSRNYGIRHAKGNYFIILDSDCILPSNYLNIVTDSLNAEYVDFFGGPDKAHDSFTSLQKAIDFSMTSVLTTGGIRGSKKSIDKFQPRSFNMGISKEAFLKSEGFGTIHPGEDPDLTFRLWELGFKSKLIEEAFVYHKRRVSWLKFYRQVYKFGLVRPILNQWHPETKRITYWFPSLFLIGFILAVLVFFTYSKWPLLVYGIYFVSIFIAALFSTKNLYVAVMSIAAVCIQFFGYGLGYLKANFVIYILKENTKTYFPELFFKANV